MIGVLSTKSYPNSSQDPKPKSSGKFRPKSSGKFNPKSSLAQFNAIQFMNAFVSPLGVACCVIVSIDHRGRVRSFTKPTLKIDVVESIYEASLVCKFPC